MSYYVYNGAGPFSWRSGVQSSSDVPCKMYFVTSSVQQPTNEAPSTHQRLAVYLPASHPSHLIRISS